RSLSFLVSSIYIFSLFFFSYYRAHRDLHSFPTRRSSDLSNIWASTRKRWTAARTSSRWGCATGSTTARWSPRSAGLRTSSGTSRSEEHTSELQSRFDLVCRLLLEKKKKKKKDQSKKKRNS